MRRSMRRRLRSSPAPPKTRTIPLPLPCCVAFLFLFLSNYHSVLDKGSGSGYLVEGFVQEIVVEVRERSAEMSEKEEICGGTRQKMLKSERSIEGGHKAGAGVVVCYDEGG
ncbi:hypothetical protein CDL15_Pgr012600 [Punica granatum]|uniref:Uncharacterized protein n=1 Tax=Punica granatum TaxID=22663 RepID=A0A218XY76_PUNGR|nr:hypothetical protein CDL15_Pgr012600 [Punica granatum]